MDLILGKEAHGLQSVGFGFVGENPGSLTVVFGFVGVEFAVGFGFVEVFLEVAHLVADEFERVLERQPLQISRVFFEVLPLAG